MNGGLYELSGDLYKVIGDSEKDCAESAKSDGDPDSVICNLHDLHGHLNRMTWPSNKAHDHLYNLSRLLDRLTCLPDNLFG